jgi:gliding motility-associated-like protein
MKKVLLPLFIFFVFSKMLAQPITVNTNQYTVPQLVQDVLFGNGTAGSSCVGTISNITWSTGTNFAASNPNGIGYFTNTNPNFPLTNGVILSTGRATAAPGPNSDNQGNGSWPGDNQLFNYIQGLGIDPGLTSYNDATILEFDFMPLTDQMSFDFLFASEEYGTYQCSYSDAFAFFLTNLTASTPPINLALVPGAVTETPISVTTIRDNAHNGGCASRNPGYFGNYNGPTGSATNFNGETVLMTATSTVIPGNIYHIKLVIADRNDSSFDSAVFLGGGSFNIGTADLSGTGTYEGITDLVIADGLGICDGVEITIQAGAVAMPGVTYHWTHNGDVIADANTNSYTISQGGEYGIVITYPGGCEQTDTMTVEYYPPALVLGTPNDLTQCEGPFNLTQNQSIIVNGQANGGVRYHHSLSDAQSITNEITNIANYTGVHNEQIFVGVEDMSVGCITVTSFFLYIDEDLCPANPLPVPDLFLCESSFNSNTAIFDLTPQTAITLGIENPAEYVITYHLSQAAADAGTGVISPLNAFPGTNNQEIFIRMQVVGDPTIFGTVSFTLITNPLPTVSISGSATICSGDSATVTFTGTPNSVVNYLVNPGATGSVTLDASGSATITQTYTANTSYTLINVTNPTTNCSQLIGGIATITVNPLPTATISGTTTVCQGTANPSITFTGANATAPYTFTYLDTNGATQTIATTAGNSVTLPVSTANAGTFAYQLVSVSSASTPACAQPQTGSATVTVVALPTATISGTTTTCLNFAEPQVVLTGFNGTAPYTFTYSLDNVVQAPVESTGNSYIINVPTTASGTFVYELISVASSGAIVCGQAQTGTATIIINDAPIINTPTAFVVCDDSLNNDGIYCYDLTQKTAEVSTDPNVIVTYHETATDAQTGANPITGLYCNIDPDAQVIYVRAHFNGSPACYTNTTLQLTINPLPLANPVITDYALCDYTNPGDGEEVFTLDTKTTEIANGQAGVTITYHASQQDAIDQVAALPNSYTNTSNPQQIWINISDNTTGCNTQSSFNLVVNPLPLAVEPLPIFECSTGSSITQAEFDLTVNESVVTGGIPGMIVTYYHTLADAQVPQSAITPPTAYLGNDNEIIYLRVQNTATGCYSTTTQLLRVTQGPMAVTPAPLERCDPNNDGFEVFDLTLAIDEIAGGTLPAGVTVTFHETETDALLGSNPLSSPYPNIDPNQQTIYVKVFYTTTGCSNYVELELIVNPTPEATEPSDYHLCDYTGAVGFESFNLTTKIPEILGSIDASMHTVTFYNDATQAQQGVGNITNIASYTNGTINQETLYVRVENNLTGCFDIVTLDLIVDPLPNATQPSYAQYSLCDNDQSNIGFEVFDLASKVEEVLLGQTGMSVTFYPSLTDAQNNSNAITNLSYQNAIIYVQTLGIRITNDATGCYVISTMDIRVEPLPEPIPPTTPYIICDANQDGVANFDLSTLIDDILGGESYIITFHETEINAQTGDHALPMDYPSIDPFVQIIYVRAEDPVTGCFSVMPITLEVNPSPVAPVNLDDIEACDTYGNNQDGVMTVNLTVRTPDALAQQPLPASNYTVTYYTSEALAHEGDFPIINTTNYAGSNGQTIWVRVENNATGCYNLGTFQLSIGIPLVVPTPQPINECDALPNDQFAVFDLTVREITALPGYTFQYYPSLSDAQNDTNQITNITSYTNILPAVQTLGVRIISTQGCVGITTLNIRVLPSPEPNTNPNVLPAVCENATNSGQAEVDLTQNQAYILNGDTNLTLQYYPTLEDLENNTNEILNPTAALLGDTTLVNDPINLVQYVYIAVSSNNNIDHTGRNCYAVVQQGYIINPLPTVDIIGTNNVYQICESDPTGNDNTEVFDLTSQIPDLLEGNQTTPTSTYSVAFYEDAALTIAINNSSSYTNTSNPQTIYVVVTNTITGCTSEVGQFELQVNPKPAIALELADFASCDDIDGVNDGQTLYNGNPLSDYIDDILGATQSPTDYTVTFYFNSQADAEAGTNAIQDLATYQVQTGTYWIRVENNATGCYITDSFEVIVEQLAEPNIVSATNIACVNFGETSVNNTLILDSQVTGDYTFEWYTGGSLIAGETGPTITVTEIDQAQVVYSVIAISNSPLGCASDTTPDATRFTVVRSGLATNVTYTVTNAFSDQQIVTVTNDGYGVYHYSLDDGPILNNGGVFTNVPLGPHTVHVWDMRDPNGYSCGVVSIEGVQIIDYPHYFTPNGDGYHDTWNIKGLENFADATKIYIFDRYGKLLKQISSQSDGWDGTFNGQLMPSTDYWFKVEYPEAGVMKEFKAHFSLKR